MPRKRAVRGKKRSSIASQSTSTLSSSILSSTMNSTMNSTICLPRPPASEGNERIDMAVASIRQAAERTLFELQVAYDSLIMSLTAEQLNTVVSLEKYSEIEKILYMKVGVACDSSVDELEDPLYFDTAATTVKKANRSRSAHRMPTISESRSRRSSSVGTCSSTSTATTVVPAFKTPVNRPILASHFSGRKYTVRKPFPVQESAMNVRRLMRKGEEAISTAGSPLFVQGASIVEPEVTIPLKDGVILNIASKRAKTNGPVPQMDGATREKLKILCENLQKCIGEKS